MYYNKAIVIPPPVPVEKAPTRILFLDIDGVLNCELYFRSPAFALQKKKAVAATDRRAFAASQICGERLAWLNELCAETGAVVVISSTWRIGRSVEELQALFAHCGATFTIIDKTPVTDERTRGVEIAQWIQKNIRPETHGCQSFDFRSYAIIDDDSDMLLPQAPHFFQTDNYSGLTPNTCYRIKRFFTAHSF